MPQITPQAYMESKGYKRTTPVGPHGRQVAKAPPGGMPFKPKTCQGKTKVGHACKAPVVQGRLYCIGHLRQQAAV